MKWLVAVLCCMCALSATQAAFYAGVSKVDATPGEGVPIAGYNHGLRAVPKWPIPQLRKYSTFMTPNEGVLDPIYVKALVIGDGSNRVCFVSLDFMSADGSLNFLAHALAQAKGFSIPLDKVTFSGSHTHSGPAAWVPETGIQITPTMDLFVPAVQRYLAQKVAEAMVQAEKSLRPALLGVGVGQLTNVTRNRRAKISPYVNATTIDSNMAVLRVDNMNGTALATLYNFAIHGTCYGASSMKYSADIMGVASSSIEQRGGGVALYINADAGDISPAAGACDNKPQMSGGITMANTALNVRKSIVTASTGQIQGVSNIVDFGLTQTNITLARNFNCTSGGPYDICTVCRILRCDINVHFGEGWSEETPRFTAFSLTIGGESTLFVTLPGESIVELGWQVRNDSQDLGFKNTFLMGYTNSYLYYFTTPREYVLGGYEALLTMWGSHTSDIVRSGAYGVAKQVAPSRGGDNTNNNNNNNINTDKPRHDILRNL